MARFRICEQKMIAEGQNIFTYKAVIFALLAGRKFCGLAIKMCAFFVDLKMFDISSRNSCGLHFKNR
jgi:hypothetical protein